ncbi:hypothetical protein [uncultured Desulfuromonas sp.]|uniref:hypothetical protein n=1 Tax=uncultured Desulfuromonas sp. TaxID=181013 RepID=UPI002AAAFA35|nr:hypothetical protein [uncultured Desulfuromonas sp.]
MTGRDLKAWRVKLVGDNRGAVRTMAEKLETPKRTYLNWEAQRGSIPGVAGVAIQALVRLSEIDEITG